MTATATVVPTDVFMGQDFYVPSFQRLQGDEATRKRTKPLDLIMQDVLRVTYNDSLTNIDSFDLTVNNWDPDKATANKDAFETSPFKYSDEATFNPWQPVELWMGYIRNGIDERQKMLTGEIVTMSPNFPASGGSTLTVCASNLLHRFRTKQQTKPFLQRQDSEIAEMIVKDIASEIKKSMPQSTLQLDPKEIEANKKRPEQLVPYLVMNNQYPILFLLDASRATSGMSSFVEDLPSSDGQPRVVTLHYRPTAADQRVVYRLEWGKSLISFQPTLQTANQVNSVTVRGWDPSGKNKSRRPSSGRKSRASSIRWTWLWTRPGCRRSWRSWSIPDPERGGSRDHRETDDAQASPRASSRRRARRSACRSCGPGTRS